MWPTTFLGRAREIERVGELFASGDWLVTLLGAAGTGKTRLAARYAELCGSTTVFCDLTQARDLGGLCASVGRALDVVLGPSDPVALLGTQLDARGDLLLVLDNCEQITTDVACAVAKWHAAAPAVRFLVTSRELLRIRGEHTYELPPMSLGEASELFVERARDVRAGYALTEPEAAVVARIVEALDRLPLAIELCAARMRIFTAAEIAGRLSRRFDVLSGGPRDVDPRQRTMRGAIEWSWNLLDDHERSALAQCSVFRGGFTLEAALAVLALGEHPAITAVQALRDKSLLRASGERLDLYESIREFAAEKLANDECGARHAEYYVGLGESLSSHIESPAALDLLLAEQHNLVTAHATSLARGARGAALQLALVLEHVYYRRGPLEAYLALVNATIAVGASTPTERALLARAHLARVRLARVGPPETRRLNRGALEDVEHALSYARATRDRAVEAQAEMVAGQLETWFGHESRGQKHFETARAIFHERDDARHEAEAQAHLGTAYHRLGRLEKAAELYTKGIEGLRAAGANAGAFLGSLGEVNQELGRWDEAVRCYEEAAAAVSGDRLATAINHGYYGTLLHERGDLDAALGMYDHALEAFRAVGSTSTFHELFLGARAAIDAERGHLDAAGAAFDEADAELGAVGDDALRTAVQIHRGHLDLARARVAEAAGDAMAASALRRGARDRLALSAIAGHPSDDVRFAFRLLERAIALGAPAETVDDSTLTVGAEGSWFVPPGTREVVELARRQHLRRLLGVLARHRLAAPDQALAIDTLFERGWPGERILPQARASRVHVALTTLRKAGLREVLLRRGAGYLLDPAVPLVFAGALTARG